METTNEISALFTLIDDPDEEVYGVVTNRIVDYGKPIIPNLEYLWETTEDASIQERIETIIHRLHFSDLSVEFKEWSLLEQPELLAGALLVSKFQYPELNTAPIIKDIEKLRRNIWLELNNYLTPLEQISIISGIIYNYTGLSGIETNYKDANIFLIHKVLETNKGNQVSNGILYLILCEMLEIPVQALQIPGQFILGYMKEAPFGIPYETAYEQVKFFIDPTSGQVYTFKDVDDYLKRIAAKGGDAFFTPKDNKQVIRYLLQESAQCFSEEKYCYKQKELQQLSSLLDQPF
ncbi:MAG: hypothetical protein H0V30_05625 [Chitinophagaceae bacterium]|jgi:regulator of sirC expression with transglutaminase-like and TPR domain|nr:hypothetical protein [Chitinophagaceae bacterium]